MIFLVLGLLVLVGVSSKVNSFKDPYLSRSFVRKTIKSIKTNRLLMLGFLAIFFVWVYLLTENGLEIPNNPEFGFWFNGLIFPMSCLGGLISLISKNSDAKRICNKLGIGTSASPIIVVFGTLCFICLSLRNFFVFMFSNQRG